MLNQSLKGITVVMLSLFALLSISCQDKKKGIVNKQLPEIIDVVIPLKNAQEQLSLQKEQALKYNKIPRTLTPEGDMHWTKPGFDWTEGFFPGSLWLLYDFSNPINI